MCRVLHLNRARYDRGRERQTGPPTARQQRHQQVTAAVLAQFAAAHERVGRRPRRQVLAQDQIRCSPGVVHRIMAEQGLVARRRRAGKRTTRRDPMARIAHITNR
ncbi:MAG: IS3 family transposase, partial [Chloroflexota bacterium]|nr:IS3 family transposase [Chloroflexota bacterium]